METNDKTYCFYTAWYHIICSKFTIIKWFCFVFIKQTDIKYIVRASYIIQWIHIWCSPFFISKPHMWMCTFYFQSQKNFWHTIQSSRSHMKTLKQMNDTKKNGIQSVARGNTNLHLKIHSISIHNFTEWFSFWWKCSSFTLPLLLFWYFSFN